ncbi:TPA: hypothetical protein MYN98_003578 [Klebsiella quasipneumoniae subsp. similipneumoniae]|uniref:hypothetical protein n=1 Tax=Klebsiella pneumoniae complex TaxID=3390273 RepID=UPI001CF2B4B9|nr:hypothetical protein [Klebsiella pneumoniae]HCB1305511.1 hypothetical protein [Klebsiella quasipneumoniae subsp. similipneumoniae]MCB3415543.1 hypothetical protein [Klebsiella pneumoniae]MCB3598720.1 hypothetical protein [Klebsiella pneumoniae]MCB3605701.1 hypothetical protein [Klebsiella pneumoniae]MCB3664919.1 hypothetical protein [Klebsiella pneumoniae]
MSFKLSVLKTVQIHYLGGYLCDKDVEIDLIYTVESVRQDDTGQVKATLSVRYDDNAKVIVGDYPISLDTSSSKSWAEQAEIQIMEMPEFSQ